MKSCSRRARLNRGSWVSRLPWLQVADLFMSAIERVTSVQRCVQIGTSKRLAVIKASEPRTSGRLQTTFQREPCLVRLALQIKSSTEFGILHIQWLFIIIWR